MLAAPIVSAPLNRLSSPFALLIVLPPLALALDAYGWSAQLAAPLRRLDPARVRLLGTYAVWLATSALLTLDVAAVAAASVGIGVAGRRADERRWQLGSAILGANVGSLLLPFSNLTNLILVSATGISLRHANVTSPPCSRSARASARQRMKCPRPIVSEASQRTTSPLAVTSSTASTCVESVPKPAPVPCVAVEIAPASVW